MSEHKLDEALRKKLLTRLPFSRTSTIDYTPEAYLTKELDEAGKDTDEFEIPENFRPIFQVRPFSKEDKDKIKKSGSKDEATLRNITRINVRGVSQLFDVGSMEELEFKADENGGMSEDQFNSLPIVVMRDLFIFISGISGLSSYERSGL